MSGKRKDELAAELYAEHQKGVCITSLSLMYAMEPGSIVKMFKRRGWVVNRERRVWFVNRKRRKGEITKADPSCESVIEAPVTNSDALEPPPPKPVLCPKCVRREPGPGMAWCVDCREDEMRRQTARMRQNEVGREVEKKIEGTRLAVKELFTDWDNNG